MLLIGMFDSCYVRRCAIAMKLLNVDFEHADWSVGADHARIRRYSPLGRVPALVLDNGEVLVDSASILDHLDDLAGPRRALLPGGGAGRREALRIVANTIGAAEKARDVIYERLVRPPEKQHEPWVERCRDQMHGALEQVEAACARPRAGEWLGGTRIGQADITAACVYTFLTEAPVGLQADRFPALAAHTARCEALPEFRSTYARWFAFESKG